MITRKIYKDAVWYAGKFQPNHPKDLVHDAYVHWWDKKGRDLFGEHPGRINTIIRFLALGQIEWYMCEGVRHNVSYQEVKCDVAGHNEQGYTVKSVPFTIPDFDEKIDNGLYEQRQCKLIYSLSTSKQKEVLDYLLEGYTPKQIVEELDDINVHTKIRVIKKNYVDHVTKPKLNGLLERSNGTFMGFKGKG